MDCDVPERDEDAAAPSARDGSSYGKIILLGLGIAAGAGAAMALYRRPLQTALMYQRAKLFLQGARVRERMTAGTRVRFWTAGDESGTAIVLVHDPFGTSESWHRVLPRISRSFRVVAPDLPGFGGSADPVDGSVGYLARMLGTLIKDEGLTGAVLVGSSLGGLVAMDAALRYPELVRGLILEDVLGFGGAMPHPALMIHDSRSDVDELQRKLWWEPPLLPSFVRDEMAYHSQRVALEVLMADVPAAGRRIEAAAGQLTVPTLVLWGDSDGLAPIEQGERINASVPGSLLVRVDHCGHRPHLEAPDDFYEIVMDFLAGPTADANEGYDL